MRTRILNGLKNFLVKDETNSSAVDNQKLWFVGSNSFSGFLFARKYFNPFHPIVVGSQIDNLYLESVQITETYEENLLVYGDDCFSAGSIRSSESEASG